MWIAWDFVADRISPGRLAAMKIRAAVCSIQNPSRARAVIAPPFALHLQRMGHPAGLFELYFLGRDSGGTRPSRR